MNFVVKYESVALGLRDYLERVCHMDVYYGPAPGGGPGGFELKPKEDSATPAFLQICRAYMAGRSSACG